MQINTFLKLRSKSLKNFFFWSILTIGLTVRIYHLGSIPTSLHVDEVSIGYNAYSILTTGKDEYGVPFPIFFKAFGEYKSPVQIYSVAPLLALFGRTEFAVRFTSVIYGILSLLAIYFLTKELLRKHVKSAEITALLAMLFLAISPWHIHYSRLGWEMSPFIFYTTFGTFLFFRALKRPSLLPLSAASILLAFYSYFAARIFIPLFVLGLCLGNIRYLITHKKESFMSALLILFFLLPYLQSISSTVALQRWNEVSVFSNHPVPQAALTHIIRNYLLHFSTDFLFVKGDSGMPGQRNTYDSVRGMGELYLWQFPFLIIGIYYLYKKSRLACFIMLFWFILYPTGSMFAIDANPLARRSVIGVIPFQLVTAVGFSTFIQRIAASKKTVLIVFPLLFITIAATFAYYLFLYFVTYPKYSTGYYGFQFGAKQIASYYIVRQHQYDSLVISPNIYPIAIYCKFYTAHDCPRTLVGYPDILYTKSKKQLFALQPDYLSHHPQYIYSPKNYIVDPYGKTVYILTEIAGFQ